MPQMGPLSWVFMLTVVLSLLLVFTVLIYFTIGKGFYLNKMNNEMKISGWKW